MIDIPEHLITAAGRGDATAFEAIYKASSGFVYSVALRIIGNTTEAEEVTQEVFVKVYGSLQGFGFRSSFKTWLYKVTMNSALNAYNKRARELGRRADYDEAGSTAAVEPIADSDIDAQETEKRVQQLLDTLTPEHRAVIVLRELEGLSYEEMAAALQININTVRTRLKRAREALMARGKKEVIGHEMR